MHDIFAEGIAMLVPILAIALGIGSGMFSLYLKVQKKREIYQLHHAERMAAIEKGIELPSLPVEFFSDHPNREPNPVRYRRTGLVLSFIGAAACLALWGTCDGLFWLWGLVPLAIGLAYLLSSRLEFMEEAKTRDWRAQP